METLFSNFSTTIIFLHVVSAVIWVGGMIVIRFVVHNSLQNIEDEKIRIGRSLEILKRFFNIIIPIILILVISAVIMVVALNLKDTPFHSTVILKESIWTIMTIIFIIIFIKRKQAQNAFDQDLIEKAKQKLSPIARYLIPLNILLGLIAIFLGVTIRGF